MSMELETPITAFSGDMKIPITLSGKEYNASILLVRDLIDLQKWLFEVPVREEKEYQKQMGDILSVEERQIRLTSAIKRGRERGNGYLFGEPGCMEHLSTPEGTLYFLWVAIRRNHPDVKPDDLNSTVQEMKTAFQYLEREMGHLLGKVNPAP